MYLDKKKRHIPKKTILIIIIVVSVLIVFITGFIMLLTTGKSIKDSLIKMPFTKDSTYLTVGKNVIYSDKDMLDAVNTSVNSLWKVKLFTSELSYSANNYMIAALSQNVVMVLDPQGGNLFSTQLNGTIKSVRLGKDKVAVYSQQTIDSKDYSYITIFDLTGQSIYQIDVTGKYILDYGLDLESGQLYVLELDTSGAAPISIITTYKPETQSITGVKELEDQLVEKILYNKGTLYTMGTNRLSIYPSLNSEAKEILVYGWVPEDIGISGNDLRFVYIPSSEAQFIAITRLIKVSGDETKINLPPNVFKILDTGDKIYCFATNNIFVYTGEGKYLRSYELPFAIDGAERAMDGYVFLTESQNVYLLPLP